MNRDHREISTVSDALAVYGCHWCRSPVYPPGESPPVGWAEPAGLRLFCCGGHLVKWMAAGRPGEWGAGAPAHSATTPAEGRGDVLRRELRAKQAEAAGASVRACEGIAAALDAAPEGVATGRGGEGEKPLPRCHWDGKPLPAGPGATGLTEGGKDFCGTACHRQWERAGKPNRTRGAVPDPLTARERYDPLAFIDRQVLEGYAGAATPEGVPHTPPVLGYPAPGAVSEVLLAGRGCHECGRDTPAAAGVLPLVCYDRRVGNLVFCSPACREAWDRRGRPASSFREASLLGPAAGQPARPVQLDPHGGEVGSERAGRRAEVPVPGPQPASAEPGGPGASQTPPRPADAFNDAAAAADRDGRTWQTISLSEPLRLPPGPDGYTRRAPTGGQLFVGVVHPVSTVEVARAEEWLALLREAVLAAAGRVCLPPVTIGRWEHVTEAALHARHSGPAAGKATDRAAAPT